MAEKKTLEDFIWDFFVLRDGLQNAKCDECQQGIRVHGNVLDEMADHLGLRSVCKDLADAILHRENKQ